MAQEGEEARWLVAAWLADDGAAVKGRLVTIDGPGAPLDEPGEVLELWRLDDAEQRAALGPHELARIDAVTLLERMVVIGVEARRDIEQPSPGDHLLVSRWLAASGEPASTVVLRGPGGGDLDLLGDARLWTYAGHDSALSVRVGLGFAWLLAIASNGLPGLVEAPGERVSVPVAATWMASADGAFGSRHVFALDDAAGQARVRVVRINRWGWSEPTQDTDELVDVFELSAAPSGAPSLALLDGVPTLVLPMGANQDALALRSSGGGALLEPIVDLRCDALGLAGPSFDGVGDTAPLACLRGGELRIGALGSE
ncbi:hypothetical protein ENSA5_57700 [Enhygromyxa salina]|uniref:Uncharacterized protein n=1 Tax=Enhygromyxa salina TaxID=215803 RepID=A0A2S9XE98_9BACT|nr:hypothetical protein ENSA5_57700 [Enhygromyxa salina]